MAVQGQGRGEKRAWAGPALFAAVLLGLIVFFWWFLSSGGRP
jgi:hypothetical protein